MYICKSFMVLSSSSGEIMEDRQWLKVLNPVSQTVPRNIYMYIYIYIYNIYIYIYIYIYIPRLNF